MQVVENTCIGHEISLRKISEPLALKALDFIPVTAQPQEMQCGRSTTSLGNRCGTYTASGVWETQRPVYKGRTADHLPREPGHSHVQVHDEASRAYLIS